MLQSIIWKKKKFKRSCNFFSVDFNPTDNNDFLNILRYQMKKDMA